MDPKEEPTVSGHVLTNPGTPKRPGSCVNRDDDLLVRAGDLLDTSSSGIAYRVTGSLGSGTFGQVFECAVVDTHDTEPRRKAAVKIIKNQAAYVYPLALSLTRATALTRPSRSVLPPCSFSRYYHQARVEIGILQLLNTQVDPHDRCHIVRLQDFFLYKGHLCLVFELLGLNLYELIRRNKFRGLSLSLVRVFVTHIIKALAVLKDSSVIHCDVKPENILLQDPKTGRVKLIDFGSACFKKKAVYTYIQSRFYRAPEVIVGHGYTEAVDMWSLGCVAAELFLGLPLFPAASEFDLLERITETIGPLPRSMLISSRSTSMYYTFEDSGAHRSQRLLTADEFQAFNMKKAVKGKQYFKHTLLRDIVLNAPFKADLTEAEKAAQEGHRATFLDFLEGLLQVDPSCRMTPREALEHPYITGEKLPKPQEVPRASTVPVTVPRSIPVPQKGTGGLAARLRAQAMESSISSQSSGNYMGTSYTPAGSLARIQSGSSLTMNDSLPVETPPSRSLGARMHGVPPCLAPMPAPTGDGRVMPIMSMPSGARINQGEGADGVDGVDEPALSSSVAGGGFVPSSVRTYRSFLGEGVVNSLRRDDSIRESDDETTRSRSTSTENAKGGDDGDDGGDEVMFDDSPDGQSAKVSGKFAGLTFGPRVE